MSPDQPKIDPDWIDFLESRIANLELRVKPLELRVEELERLMALLKQKSDPY
jgi:hypothetical protein